MSTKARMQQRIERFDHFRVAIKQWHDRAVVHARNYRNCLRALRKDAYEIGVLICQAQKEWHNELIDLAKQDGFKKLDEWIDDKLAVVDMLHENRSTFLVNIANGMTLNQYMNKGGLWGIAKNPVQREKATDDVSSPPPASARMTDKELIDYYRNVVAAMRSELKELREENKQLRREVSILERFRKELAKAQ